MKTKAEQLWESAQALLRSLLPADIYELWYAPVRAAGMDAMTLTLTVADHCCEMWLRDHHAAMLEEVIAKVAGRPLAVRFQVAAAAAPARRRGSSNPGIDPRNTFATFVAGNNGFAHSAAQAIAQAPGRSYNPLLLCGDVGLGKTHLLHAIGLQFLAHQPVARVTCVTIKQFTIEFVAALRARTIPQFRNKYRQSDMLLVDDVQRVAGREPVQLELLQLFNTLHAERKQVVLTCDRAAGLDERIRQRFEWGLVIDLQPPDLETRLTILRQRAVAMSITLPDGVAAFLAKRIPGNIRRLEGALVRVVSYANLTGNPLSVPLAAAILRDVLIGVVPLTDFPWRTSGPVGPSSSFGLN